MNYPIWNDVTACIYKSDKSYGVKENGEVKVLIGTSKTNSFDFLTHKITCRESLLHEPCLSFYFYVDNILIKKALYNKRTKQLINNSWSSEECH
jgi:hypothetical protein